MYNNGVMSSDL
jgi:hypothetical protein